MLIGSGRTLRPAEALEAGLVDALAPPETLETEAMEVAGRLAGVRPKVFALTKRQLRAPVRHRIRTKDDATGADVARLWTSPETVAAIERFSREDLEVRVLADRP